MVNTEVKINTEKLSSLEDIQEAYNKLCSEEVVVGERLEWSLSNRHHLEARLSHVAHLVPTLQLVEADAKKLKSTISFTHQLATTVSAKVRQLDLAKSRVCEVQKRVGDLLDLEGCAEGVTTALTAEDYEKAAGHIHRFLSMDEALLRHSADANNRGQSVEVWFSRLHEASDHLKELLNVQFQEAVENEDEASIERFFKLFPLLNLQEEGLQKFTHYLCFKIREMSEKNLSVAVSVGHRDKRAHVIWADTITLLFEGIARTIEIRQPIIETYYKPGQLCNVIRLIQEECDKQAVQIFAHMKRARQLGAIEAKVNNALRHSSMTGASKEVKSDSIPDPRDLDTLLGELTLMNARAELYFRFLKRRVHGDFEASVNDSEKRSKATREFDGWLLQSRLNCEMAELVGVYSIVEQFYLNESFRKALEMEAVEGQSHTTSLVDDAFYIIKKSVRRAIASNSVDGVCAMLNHSVELLENKLASHFHSTLKKGFPAQGFLDLDVVKQALQSGKLNSISMDSDGVRQSFLLSLNNAETSVRHISSLSENLKETIKSAVSGVSKTDNAKLESCLSDLQSSGSRLKSVVDFGLCQLQATAVKPKIKPWVDDFTIVSHEITEEEFAMNEANDPFSQGLMVHIDGLLGSFVSLLTPNNHKALVSIIVAEVALQMEKVVLKSKFSRLGGLQCDREVRVISTYLSQVSEWSVREQLGRLQQMATLLNLEHINEVREYYGTVTWRLTPMETKQVLQLRTDFKAEEIKLLKLN